MEVSRSLGPVDVRPRATFHPRRRLVGPFAPFRSSAAPAASSHSRPPSWGARAISSAWAPASAGHGPSTSRCSPPHQNTARCSGRRRCAALAWLLNWRASPTRCHRALAWRVVRAALHPPPASGFRHPPASRSRGWWHSSGRRTQVRLHRWTLHSSPNLSTFIPCRRPALTDNSPHPRSHSTRIEWRAAADARAGSTSSSRAHTARPHRQPPRPAASLADPRPQGGRPTTTRVHRPGVLKTRGWRINANPNLKGNLNPNPNPNPYLLPNPYPLTPNPYSNRRIHVDQECRRVARLARRHTYLAKQHDDVILADAKQLSEADFPGLAAPPSTILDQVTRRADRTAPPSTFRAARPLHSVLCTTQNPFASRSSRCHTTPSPSPLRLEEPTLFVLPVLQPPVSPTGAASSARWTRCASWTMCCAAPPPSSTAYATRAHSSCPTTRCSRAAPSSRPRRTACACASGTPPRKGYVRC